MTFGERLYTLVRDNYKKRKAEASKKRWERIPLSQTLIAEMDLLPLVPTGKICLYSTFDPYSVVDDYVLEQLKYWCQHGFQIILISTSPAFPTVALERVSPWVIRVLHRKNWGLDFASWSLACQRDSNIFQCRQLLLTNDSVFGPFVDFYPTITVDPDSVLGLTDSFAVTHHLQSYCLFFGSQVIASARFQNFVRSVKIKQDKTDLILSYEMGLSRDLRQEFSLKAMFPYKELLIQALGLLPEVRMQALGRLRDAPIVLWDFLLDRGFPFLKRSLLQVNQAEDYQLQFWFQRIRNPEQVRIISNYLARVGSAVMY